MQINKLGLTSLLTGLLFALATGCSENAANNSAERPAEIVGEVNVYSSRHYDTDEALYDSFTQQTGIEVNIIEGSADELIERLKSEGANSPADVLITVDVGRLWRAQQEGLLQPIESEVLESTVPENLQAPDNTWFGLSKRARVIAYSTERVDPAELSTYEALAEPQWQGRVCVRSSENIYNQSLVASKIEELGEAGAQEWVEGLVNNLARPPQGNDTGQIEAIASGECDVALVNHYYYARLVESDHPRDQEAVSAVGIFFPNPTHINISGAGVVATAPHQENAVQFLEYLVTPQAQAIFANGNYEYPVVAEVEANPTIAGFGEFQEANLEVAAYGENNPEAVKVMNRAGWR